MPDQTCHECHARSSEQQIEFKNMYVKLQCDVDDVYRLQHSTADTLNIMKSKVVPKSKAVLLPRLDIWPRCCLKAAQI